MKTKRTDPLLIDKINSRIIILESKLFDAKVESHQRLRNNPYAGARYRSMVNTVSKKVDAIQNRIDKEKSKLSAIQLSLSV